MNTASAPAPSPATTNALHAALAARAHGDFADAEARLQTLTVRWPDCAEAWHVLGLLLHRRGATDEALKMLTRAQVLAPGNFDFLLDFAAVLTETGRTAFALRCLQRAQALRPDDTPTLMRLAETLIACERGGEACAELERHLGWAGDQWRVWTQLGRCREQGRERPAALAAYAEAARLAPADEIEPLLRRGGAAERADQPELAEQAYNEALERAPDKAGARVELANLASQRGDFALAERLLREALACNPNTWSAWVALATAHRLGPGDGLGAELDAAGARAGADPSAWSLHIARGQVWEKLGDYERAWTAYELGNRQHFERHPYARGIHEAYTRDLIEHLDADFIARAARVGRPDPGAIFICGMPRSGTTLLETILAAHPDIAAGGEQTHVHDWLRRRIGVVGMSQVGNWLAAADDATLIEMADFWRSQIRRTAAGSPRVTDKLPGNYALMGMLQLCFPDAPIIHIRRDARDNCFSCFATSFSDRHAFTYELASMAHSYRLYQCLIAHWHNVFDAGRIIEMSYERLVAEPEAEIRRLLAALELDWDARCLAFHESKRRVRTASVYQVRQPLYATSVGRWRHFAAHLGPLIAGLEGPPPL